MWVYIQIARAVRGWEVGHYSGSGRWIPESGHDSSENAATRCNYLNGGIEHNVIQELLNWLHCRPR